MEACDLTVQSEGAGKSFELGSDICARRRKCCGFVYDVGSLRKVQCEWRVDQMRSSTPVELRTYLTEVPL